MAHGDGGEPDEVQALAELEVAVGEVELHVVAHVLEARRVRLVRERRREAATVGEGAQGRAKDVTIGVEEDVGARVECRHARIACDDRRNLLLHAIGVVQVVSLPVQDDRVSTRGLHCGNCSVALGADGCARVDLDELNVERQRALLL